MGDFGKTECCLMDFSETLLAHPMMKLSIVGQKNLVSGDYDLLMLTLIICWDKFSCWEDLIYSERDLIVGGKDLKNWWNWI